jgi:ligand-binding sensor domain-containing protein
MSLYKFLISSLLLLFLSFTKGQQFAVVNYGLDSELSSNNVIDLCYYKGHTYVATDKKIFYYNGLSFIELEYISKVVKSNIIKKMQFSNNTIIILFENGDYVEGDLSTEKIKVITNENVIDVFALANDIFFLKTDFSIVSFDQKKRRVKFIRSICYLNSKVFFYVKKKALITYFRNKIFVFIPQNGIFIVNDREASNVSYPEGYQGKISGKFLNVRDKLLFLGGIHPYFYNEEKGRFTSFSLIKPNISCFQFGLDIVSFKKKYYFIQNSKNLVCNDEHGNSYNINLYDNNLELRKLLIVGANLLIATSKGLYIINEEDKHLESFKEDYNSNVHYRTRRKILEIPNGIILFGNPIPISIKNNKIRIHKIKPLPIYDAVSINHGFLLGTEGWGIKYIDSYLKKTLSTNLSNGIVRSICFDQENKIILAANESKLYIFNSENIQLQKSYDLPYKGVLTQIIVKKQNSNMFFLGTEKGVYVFENGRFRIIKTTGKKYVGDIHIDYNTNRLIVGHDEGIDFFSLDKLKYIRTVTFDFLINPRVCCIVNDYKGNMWISTFSGIVCLTNNGNVKFLLNKRNGLLNSEYNYKSSCKLSDGRIIFGGLDGYDIINPKLFYQKDYSVKGLVFTVFFKNDAKTVIHKSSSQEVTYDRDDYTPRVYIYSNQFIPTGGCYFEYKVEGDSHWRIVKNNYIDLVNFEAGTWILKLRGYDSYGRVIKFRDYKIRVTQKFYKSTLFYVTIFFFFIFLISVILFQKVKNVESKQKIYNEISMDLHDSVGTILSKTLLFCELNKTIPNLAKDKIISNINDANFSLRTYIFSKPMSKILIQNVYLDIIEIINDFFIVKEKKLVLGTRRIKNSLFISGSLYRDLKLCIYEVSSNITKYSSSKEIILSFYSNNLYIDITLTCIGEENKISKNNKKSGLNNIKYRTKKYSGDFYINENEDKQEFRLIFQMNHHG